MIWYRWWFPHHSLLRIVSTTPLHHRPYGHAAQTAHKVTIGHLWPAFRSATIHPPCTSLHFSTTKIRPTEGYMKNLKGTSTNHHLGDPKGHKLFNHYLQHPVGSLLGTILCTLRGMITQWLWRHNMASLQRSTISVHSVICKRLSTDCIDWKHSLPVPIHVRKHSFLLLP